MTHSVFFRWYSNLFQKKLQRPFVHILFGARQTGKSTLVNQALPKNALVVNLADPGERAQFSAHPEDFMKICRGLPVKKERRTVFVDEAQAIPAIFDAVQALYDSDKTRWRFILCGSSARKLRHTGANLLPGRSFFHRLYPLTMAEHPAPQKNDASVDSPFPFNAKYDAVSKSFPAWDLLPRLAFGALPGIVAADEVDREDLLRSYVALHLEEEVRRETAIRDWGAFLRFIQLAATESGQIVNYSTISRDSGVSLPTVKSYYQLLEEMFVGFQIPAFSRSSRKNLLSTPRFYFFDVGVRNAAAGLKPSEQVVLANPGPLFEQWVGIEIWKRIQYMGGSKLFFLRSSDGAEIDFIIETQEKLIPIEVKWTERPATADARNLRNFIKEQGEKAPMGYIVCRCQRPMLIEENILALPWHAL
ncbi:MAG: ATP-binding protein [Candidatus Riflebacteria bacterium]|nr:ATP-binding protein [Candidatus Riflebacteria bacterium]